MYSRGTIDLVSYTTSCDGELNNRSISETLTLEQRMRAWTIIAQGGWMWKSPIWFSFV